MIELGERGPRLRLEAGDDAGEEMLEAAPWEREGSLASTRALVAREPARRSPRRCAALARGRPGARARDGRLQPAPGPQAPPRGRAPARGAARGGARARGLRRAHRGGARARRDGPGGALAHGSTSCATARRRSTRRSGRPRRRRRGRCARSCRRRATRLATLETERAAGERIVRDYGPGVCLIQGAYPFRDAEGRPLRYKLDDERQRAQGRRRQPAARPRGAGPGPRGRVRRHRLPGRPARPGAHEPPRRRAVVERRARAVARRARLQRRSRRCCAPSSRSEKRPFELRVERHAEHADLSLVRCDLAGARLPDAAARPHAARAP